MEDFIKQAQKIHKEFVEERDWKKFHTPKNISMALSIEVSELMENFQWLTGEESLNIQNPETQQNIKEEIADVFCYLIRLADLVNVDIQTAFLEKMEQNRKKYPVELSRGHATKYNKLP